MKIISVLFIGILIISLGSAFSFGGWFFGSNSTPLVPKNINVTLDNFAGSFKDNVIVMDLPRGAAIKLSVGGRDFFIGQGLIEKFDGQNVDASIRFPKKYISELSTENYCRVLRKAISAKDYSGSLKLSRVSFIWKYRKLISYHRCFGF